MGTVNQHPAAAEGCVIVAPSSVPPFYDPPAPLPPGPPGSLIRVEPIATHARIRAWRVLYHSTTRTGDDIAVSGMVLAPQGDPPPGGFPLLASAHGTTGVNRNCAPSIAPEDTNALNVSSIELLLPYVEAGFVVAATDYQGLGAPGDPAYLVGEVEGRNVLDAARAARALPDLTTAPTLLIIGHSQGGHAAAFAAQIVPTYAPEEHLAGVVLLAPASELELLAAGIALVRRPTPGVAFLVAAMYSWSLIYPDARLDAVLTEEGIRTVETLKQQCGLQMYPPFETQPPHHFFNPLGIVMNHAWRSAIFENVPGHTRIHAPVFVGQGQADPVVPPFVTEIFVKRLQIMGNAVTLHTYPGADHMGLLDACKADAIAWLGDRLTAPDKGNEG